MPCKVLTSPLLAAHSVDLQWSVYGDVLFVIVLFYLCTPNTGVNSWGKSHLQVFHVTLQNVTKILDDGKGVTPRLGLAEV